MEGVALICEHCLTILEILIIHIVVKSRSCMTTSANWQIWCYSTSEIVLLAIEVKVGIDL